MANDGDVAAAAASTSDDGDDDAANQREINLLQFQDMFSLTDDEARRLMDQCNYNIELAVQEYLNMQDGRPSNLAGVTASTARDNGVDGDSDEDAVIIGVNYDEYGADEDGDGVHIRRRELVQRRVNEYYRPVQRAALPAAPRPLSWMEWLWRWASLPFTFAYSTFNGALAFVYGVLIAPLLVRRPPPITAALGDSVVDIEAFRRRFERAYGTEHVPFAVVSYKEIVRRVRENVDYVLVYVHDWTREDATDFCQSTLCSPVLVTFAREHSLQVWPIDRHTQLGAHVANTLRLHRLPALALLGLVDGQPSVVDRLTGVTSTPQFSDRAVQYWLNTAIRDNADSVAAARMQREQRQADQLLRAEQEQAYQAGLARDRERQAARDDEARRAAEEACEREREAALDVRRAERDAELRAACAAIAEAAGKGDARVGVTMPNGTRLTLMLKEDDRLSLVYAHCMAAVGCPSCISLFTAHPRTQIAWRPRWLVDRAWLTDEDDGAVAAVLVERDENEPTVTTAGVRGQMLYVHDDDA